MSFIFIYFLKIKPYRTFHFKVFYIQISTHQNRPRGRESLIISYPWCTGQHLEPTFSTTSFLRPQTKFGPTTNIRFRLGTLKRKEYYQHCSSMSMLALSDDSINWQAIRSTNCAMRRVKTVTSRHSWLNKPAVTPANSDKKSNHGSIIILSAS